MISIVAPASQADPEMLGPLTEAITLGDSAAFADAVTAAVVVAAILAGCTRVTRDAVDVDVPIACAVAAQHGVDPTLRLRRLWDRRCTSEGFTASTRYLTGNSPLIPLVRPAPASPAHGHRRHDGGEIP